jgi:tRNA(Ile2) C34 agmatinyltransferase TiaS
VTEPEHVDVRDRRRRSSLAGKFVTVRRLCNACGYAWGSVTYHGKGDETRCPRCGEAVPGDSYERGR